MSLPPFIRKNLPGKFKYEKPKSHEGGICPKTRRPFSTYYRELTHPTGEKDGETYCNSCSKLVGYESLVRT
jgi:hypothetical protein